MGRKTMCLTIAPEVMLTAKQSMASASPNNIASVMYMFACFCLGLNVEYDVESTADT